MEFFIIAIVALFILAISMVGIGTAMATVGAISAATYASIQSTDTD